ncbi:MAG: CPBP family intramembrane glutamic endopeptidase [Cyanobacteria bacterium P01_D01_bin.105]
MTTQNNPLVANPFLAIKSRYLIFGTFLIASFITGVVYALLGEWQLIPKTSEDPISTPVLTIAVLTLMAIAIFLTGRKTGLNAQYLFGQKKPKFSIAYSLVLVLSLLLCSLGISSIIFYVLSLISPGYVSQLLENGNLLQGNESTYPHLYEALMLFLLLVYAPIVEELIFRGILLQRWSAKWGLRLGVITSSVLFGVLHFNNPIGLTLFGLVMGLLYVRTRSLWVPIACHALNNLAAVGIDWLSWVTAGGQTSTVDDVQQLWWMSLILVGVSLPFLVWFVWRSWPSKSAPLPYLKNASMADSLDVCHTESGGQ